MEISEIPPATAARERLIEGCGSMSHLLGLLLDSKGRVADEVHAIRKLGKSLRGGFSLFGLGKSSAREIQAIGRLLSASRDAVSRRSTWERLGWESDSLVAGAIAGLLEQQTHSAARRPPPEAIAWCIERVDHAREALVALPEETLEDTIAKGLRRLEKDVRKCSRRMHRRGEDDFHDTRKALKAYLGAIGFLPSGEITPDPKMTELAELLGDENDLATLSDWLIEHGFTDRFAPELWKKLKKSRRKLQSRAVDDARGSIKK
jgi:CHAD domain